MAARAGAPVDAQLCPALFSGHVRCRVDALPAPSPGASIAERRRRRAVEFAAGRALSGKLLRSLGAEDGLIGTGADRAPLWPPGFVGSIAHSDTLLFVAVAPQPAVASLGVDVAPLLSPAALEEIAPLLLRDGELDAIGAIDATTGTTTVFSAKEALYKCLAPLTGRFFDFQAAEIIDLNPASGRLCLRLATDLSKGFSCGSTFHGSFAVAQEHVFTAVELDAASATLFSSR